MRFFAANPADNDRSGNLVTTTCLIHSVCRITDIRIGFRNLQPAGLVVDQVVTHPYAFDFYLQAHAGLVGTVSGSETRRHLLMLGTD